MSLVERDLSEKLGTTEYSLPSRDKPINKESYLNENARRILADRYVVGNEQPEDIFARVAKAFGSNEGHSARLLSYMEKQWLMPASPILSNGGVTPRRAENISCYLQYVPDSRQGIADHIAETIMLSTNGGGCGAYFGDLRSIGTKTSTGAATTGMISYMSIMDRVMRAASQGHTRRGSAAEYVSIDHPEIVEFINMRSEEGGDPARKNYNLNHGVCITDKFMEAVEVDQIWELVDPHTKEVKEVGSARSLWELILETRLATGQPYILFVDQANAALHPDLREQGLKVTTSNLCSEIVLPVSEDRTAVCCLS